MTGERRGGSAKWAIIAVLSLGTNAWAANGVSPTEIKLGASSPLTGPLGNVGRAFQAGASTYFKKINADGGIHGRKIVTVVLDDAYNAQQTRKNVDRLISEEKVFALYGSMGTSTSSAALPAINREDIPFLFPSTGASVLRTQPPIRNVFNQRPSYLDEGQALADYVLSKTKANRIGIFVQDDGFGQSIEAGVMKAFNQKSRKLTMREPYVRSAPDFSGDIARSANHLKLALIDTVFLLCTDDAAMEFIKAAKAIDYHPRIAMISIAATARFLTLGKDVEGVATSSVFPLVDDLKLPLVRDYRRDMKAAGIDDFETFSLEGYMAARLIVEAVRLAGNPPTREGLRNALEDMKIDLGGWRMEFKPQTHSAATAVGIAVVHDGKLDSLK